MFNNSPPANLAIGNDEWRNTTPVCRRWCQDMTSCPTKPMLRRIRVVTGLCALILLCLAASGRVWPGQQYPMGMLLVAFLYAMSVMGYVVAWSITPGNDPSRAQISIWRRIQVFVEWAGIIICIVGRFWWGWYFILLVLFEGLWKKRKEKILVRGWIGRVLAYGWLLDAIVIVYIAFNRSFFSP